MTEIDLLKYSLNQFANLDEKDFALSEKYWQNKEYAKCDKNIFLYSLHQ